LLALLDSGLGEILEHLQKMALQLESELSGTQNRGCKDLAEQKDVYESRVDKLRWRIIGLEREKLALQDKLAAPPP